MSIRNFVALHTRLRNAIRRFKNEAMARARRFGRAPFTRAAALLYCVCFNTVLATPSFPQGSPIAILAMRDDSGDAFLKVVGALCKKRGVHEEGRDEQSFCRNFEDEREVSSLLMQNAEAFAAIVTEVRGVVCKS